MLQKKFPKFPWPQLKIIPNFLIFHDFSWLFLAMLKRIFFSWHPRLLGVLHELEIYNMTFRSGVQGTYIILKNSACIILKNRLTLILKQTVLVSLHLIYNFISVYLNLFTSHVRWEYIEKWTWLRQKFKRNFQHSKVRLRLEKLDIDRGR